MSDNYEPVEDLCETFEERTDREVFAMVVVSYDYDTGKVMVSSAMRDYTDDVRDGDAKREVSAAVRRWLRDFEEGECLETVK